MIMNKKNGIRLRMDSMMKQGITPKWNVYIKEIIKRIDEELENHLRSKTYIGQVLIVEIRIKIIKFPITELFSVFGNFFVPIHILSTFTLSPDFNSIVQ